LKGKIKNYKDFKKRVKEKKEIKSACLLDPSTVGMTYLLDPLKLRSDMFNIIFNIIYIIIFIIINIFNIIINKVFLKYYYYWKKLFIWFEG